MRKLCYVLLIGGAELSYSNRFGILYQSYYNRYLTNAKVPVSTRSCYIISSIPRISWWSTDWAQAIVDERNEYHRYESFRDSRNLHHPSVSTGHQLIVGWILNYGLRWHICRELFRFIGWRQSVYASWPICLLTHVISVTFLGLLLSHTQYQ